VEKWPRFRPSRILARLVEHEVDFVVIGGYAAIAHGSGQQTIDLDICFATDRQNLDRLGAALTALNARLRGVEENVPFIPDAATLRKIEVLALDTNEGPLDVLATPSGAPSYAILRRRALIVELAGIDVPVASFDDLVSMKRAAGRPKDKAALAELREIPALKERIRPADES
jgi:hypothetical protein